MNSQILQNLLNLSIELNGGEDAALEACDSMYSMTFRSEGYPISDYLKLNNCSVHPTEFKAELLSNIATHCYVAQGKGKMPKYPNSDEYSEEEEYALDCEMDHYFDTLEQLSEHAVIWFTTEFPDYKITNETLIVDFCNYKGEGEGEPDLLELHKSKKIFTTKRDSFYKANT
jgi:hypothetical protein